jgi:hypothetical protein
MKPESHDRFATLFDLLLSRRTGECAHTLAATHADNQSTDGSAAVSDPALHTTASIVPERSKRD